MTSQKQTSLFTEEELTSCPEGFLASRTAPQESGSGKMMNATSGQRCLEQFERFGHVGSWAKMFSGLLIGMEGWSSRRCKLTWKLKGTKSNRMYFQLRVSMLPTEEIGFGLLPTPNTMDTLPPKEAYQMLPTPTAQCEKGGRAGIKPRKGHNPLTNNLGDTMNYIEQTGKSSQLNPRFVLEMMGFPPNWTELPFQSGETNQSKPQETP